MPISLDAAVQAQVDAGALRILPLVKFDLPGKVVGYHIGGRPLTYGGLEYKPNRWLEPDSFDNALGNEVTARTLTFSDVPTTDPDDAIANIEQYDYVNAPVTVSYLAGDPQTDQVLGVLSTQFYEINEVNFEVGEADDSGERTVTLHIEIEPPQRRFSDQTYARASDKEQKFDNDATDDFFQFVATSPDWVEEWGQVQR